VLDYTEHREKKQFRYNDPCIWIVYPYGCAGDLLASIISYHYRSIGYGPHYQGINNKGQVSFVGSDQYFIGEKDNGDEKVSIKFDSEFLNQLNTRFNYTECDQLIFSTHMFLDEDVNSILSNFKNAKVIHIEPKNQYEEEIRCWLGNFKNESITLTLPNIKNINEPVYQVVDGKPGVSNARVLQVTFGDLFNETTFEKLYDSIVTFLDLPGKLIRYDFVKYWKEQQAPEIRPFLKSCDS